MRVRAQHWTGADEATAAEAEANLLEAFSGHPMIGDAKDVAARFGAIEAAEQSGADSASQTTMEELAKVGLTKAVRT